jgi:hypothetical protein
MKELRDFNTLPIDWGMEPEDAVAKYLEWGGANCKNIDRLPVKGKFDISYYFVVNTWEECPTLILIKRGSDHYEELGHWELPEPFRKEYSLKGVYKLTDELKDWVKAQMQ